MNSERYAIIFHSRAEPVQTDERPIGDHAKKGVIGLFRKGMPVALAALVLILTGCSSPEQADPCGPRSTLEQNLRTAAEQNPVPDWNISMEARTETWWTRATEEQLQPWLKTQNVGFTVGQEQAELMLWAERTTGKEPGHHAELVRFPKGDLRPDTPFADVVAAAKGAEASKQADVIGTWSYRPLSAPTGARDGFHEWNLPDAYRWYQDEADIMKCVTKTVMQITDEGPVRRLELPMLEVGARKFVGFVDGKAVTLEHEAGLFGYGSQILWYTVPGLK